MFTGFYSKEDLMSDTEIFWSVKLPTEKQMEAFAQICGIAEHGASYEQNWEALGYSYPKNNLISFFFSNEENKKSKILYEELLDIIISIGVLEIGTASSSIIEYLKVHNQRLKNQDIKKSLERIDRERLQRKISNKGIADRFQKEGLSTDDAERLDRVLNMIEFSYSELFSEMFKEFRED